jgi:hypothetical protein
MNYNQVNFQLFVENTLTDSRILQKEVPEGKSHPYLIVANKSKSTHLTSRDEILKYLLLNKYLKKGVTHSAWEQQTYDHLIQNTYHLGEGLSVGFTNRLKQSFRIIPKANKGEAFGQVSRSFKDAILLSFEDRFQKKMKKTSLSTFELELNEWRTRLNNQDFHGGLTPDKADFLMFAIVETNWVFLKDLFKGNLILANWKDRMSKCSQQDFTTK